MNIRLKILNIAAIGLFVIGSEPLLAGLINISVVPASESVVLGSAVTITLRITGLGQPPSLGTFDLNLGFNPGGLSFDSATFGDPLLGDQLDPTGGGNTINFVTSGIGTVELFELSLATAGDLNTLQVSNFALVRLQFNTVGAGTSPLILTANALGDENGNSLSVNLVNGSIDVGTTSAAPEPGTLALCAGGLITWLFQRHKFPKRLFNSSPRHAIRSLKPEQG